MDNAQKTRATGARFKFQAQAARNRYERRCEEIAVEVREKLIEPFCVRWGVSFSAGMGVWDFCAPGSSPRSPGESFTPDSFEEDPEESAEDHNYRSFGLPPEFWTEFSALFEALSALNDQNDMIATYCADVKV